MENASTFDCICCLQEAWTKAGGSSVTVQFFLLLNRQNAGKIPLVLWFNLLPSPKEIGHEKFLPPTATADFCVHTFCKITLFLMPTNTQKLWTHTKRTGKIAYFAKISRNWSVQNSISKPTPGKNFHFIKFGLFSRILPWQKKGPACTCLRECLFNYPTTAPN